MKIPKVFINEKSFYKSFLSLLSIIALQYIISFVVNLADNIMLGAYSEYAMSGAAIVNQIQFLLQMVIIGVGEGLIVFTSRFWGAKDINQIKKIINIGLALGILIAFTVWVIVFSFPEQCLYVFTDNTNIVDEGIKYLKIVCFTYVFFAITNILLCSLRSVETVKIGFITTLISLCVNVFLNYVFIFGNFGAIEMGAAGAAAATLIARIIECSIVVFYVFRIDQKIKIKFRDLLRIEKYMVKNYFRIASPVICEKVSWGLAICLQAVMLGHMGSQAIAANSIASALFQIISVFASASASATAVVLGKTIGEGNDGKIKPYAKTLQAIFLLIGIFSGTILFFAKDLIISFYNITPESMNMAVQFMTVLSVTIIGTSYQMPCLTGIVRSGGDTKFVFFNDLVFMWGIVLPVSAIAAFYFNCSPVVVFICLKSDQILKCIVAVIKVNRFKWIRNLNPMVSHCNT